MNFNLINANQLPVENSYGDNYIIIIIIIFEQVII